MAPRCRDRVCMPFDPSRAPLPPAFFRKYVRSAPPHGVDVFLILQEEEPEMFERQPPPGGASSLAIRARCAFLRCARRPAAPPSTRARLSLPLRCSHRPPSGMTDHVPVLVLSGDVRAHVRRAPPLHARAIAAARRGQRRQAAVARSGQVDGIAAGGLEPRSGTTVWPLARAFY